MFATLSNNRKPFNIHNIDNDILPEITMTVESYNGQCVKISPKYTADYGFKTNYIVIQYEGGKLKITDQKR